MYKKLPLMLFDFNTVTERNKIKNEVVQGSK